MDQKECVDYLKKGENANIYFNSVANYKAAIKVSNSNKNGKQKNTATIFTTRK